MTNRMSHPGTTLQGYNQELVKCLEDLKMKRNTLLQVVAQEEQDKKTIEKNIETLEEKLVTVNDNLQKHKAVLENFDKTIRDTEAGFKKILESSQLLLNLAQQEANRLISSMKESSSDHLNEPRAY